MVICNLHHASPRIPAITHYLSEFGWKVSIISTPLGANPYYSLGLPEGFLNKVRVIEVPYAGDTLTCLRKLLMKFGFSNQESFTEQIKEKMGVRKSHSWVDLLLWLVQELISFPDGERTWRIPALRRARKLIANENFDFLLSSSPYPTSHVIASMLQKEFNMKWLADFRDTWTQNPVYPFSRCRQIVESRYERYILRNSVFLTTVSHDYAESLRKDHIQPIHVIPNGYQGDLSKINKRRRSKKFTLTYTGMIYLGQQAPDKPLRAIKQLVDQGVIDREDIKVRFYGRKNHWLQLLIGELGLDDIVAQYGQIPRYEARKRQEESVVLIFLNWEDRDNKGLSHLKLYEYLRSGSQILASGGYAGSEVEQILNETHSGIYATTEQEIKNALTDLYCEYKRKGNIIYRGNQKAIAQHSYFERAKSLNKLLCSHGRLAQSIK